MTTGHIKQYRMDETDIAYGSQVSGMKCIPYLSGNFRELRRNGPNPVTAVVTEWLFDFEELPIHDEPAER